MVGVSIVQQPSMLSLPLLERRWGRNFNTFSTMKMVFPPGIYITSSSIDLTCFSDPGFATDGCASPPTATNNGVIEVDAYGAYILAQQLTGHAVIAMMGSNSVIINGLFIYANNTGGSGKYANIGIEYGRTVQSISAGNIVLRDVTVDGFYSVAPIYNLAAETSLHEHVYAKNRNAATGTYSLILDGENFWTITPDGTPTQNIIQYAHQSFTLNTFLASNYLSGASANVGSTPIWVSDAEALNFIGSYANTTITAGPCVTISAHTSANITGNLSFGLHCETATNNTFLFNGAYATPHVKGFFEYRDPANFSTAAVFATGGSVTGVTFDDLEMNIDHYVSAGSTTVFDTAANYTFAGKYAASTSAEWNGSTIQNFQMDLIFAGVKQPQSLVTILNGGASGTYTAASGAKTTCVTGVGPGGGGGQGSVLSTAGSGGAGGGGGGREYACFPSANVTGSAYSVGTGGPGGTGAVSSSSPGNNGTAGSGPTTFGTCGTGHNCLLASAGGGGAGGQTTAANSGGGGGGGVANNASAGSSSTTGTGASGNSGGGSGGSGATPAGAFTAGGGAGGAGGPSGVLGVAGGAATYGGGGGGSGGGLAASPADTAGGNGGANGFGGATAAGAAGSHNGATGQNAFDSCDAGGGGSGGGASASTTSGNGGQGAIGGGGGGGGASVNGQTPGTGGAGGAGCIKIVESR